MTGECIACSIGESECLGAGHFMLRLLRRFKWEVPNQRQTHYTEPYILYYTDILYRTYHTYCTIHPHYTYSLYILTIQTHYRLTIHTVLYRLTTHTHYTYSLYRLFACTYNRNSRFHTTHAIHKITKLFNKSYKQIQTNTTNTIIQSYNLDILSINLLHLQTI